LILWRRFAKPANGLRVQSIKKCKDMHSGRY
jgi:hypothetical protein